jgi:predicted site-specific integrase-resolvase
MKKCKGNLEVTVGKLHSIESAAEFLGGISPWTIRRWLSDGKLQRIKVGSRTMVAEQELISMAKPETPAQAAARNISNERRSTR